jgi:hypothetical protein
MVTTGKLLLSAIMIIMQDYDLFTYYVWIFERPIV